jgi:hypothetical protein
MLVEKRMLFLKNRMGWVIGSASGSIGYGLRTPRWEDTSSINFLMEDCRAAIAQIDYISINKRLVQVQNGLPSFAKEDERIKVNRRMGSTEQVSLRADGKSRSQFRTPCWAS